MSARHTPLHGARVRVLQMLALALPGAETVRVSLHRARGVKIGDGCFIGTGVMLDTMRPELIRIGDRVALSVRVTVVAHFRDLLAAERGSDPYTVEIEDDVFIGPGAIILPGVKIGHGAVVTAGTVVSSSVAPLTMVRGNPARPVARCGIPLGVNTAPSEFYRQLQPLGSSAPETP